jgi:hypothetical protein
MDGPTQKGLEFTLKLRDQMSKNIKKITGSLSEMEQVLEEMSDESGDASKKVQGAFSSLSSTLKNFVTQSNDAVHILGDKKNKESLVARQEDTRKTLEDLNEEFQERTTPSVEKLNDIFGDFSQTLLSSIAVLFSAKKALTQMRESADIVQESLIEINKKIALSEEHWESLRSQFLKSSIDMLFSSEKMNEVFSQISIVQMRGKESIEEFIKAASLLSNTTELSATEAGNAMKIYALWYKGGSVGMIGLANAIRYVATNTKLSANEANELLNSFVAVSKNLEKNVRGKIAPQVLALGAAFREVEAPIQDLSKMFEGLTTKYSMNQRKMILFFSQMTQTSVEEINKMIESADFIRLNELFMKSVDKMPEDMFLMMRDTFEEATGLSWESARAFRQMSKEQKEGYQKIIEETTKASTRSKELNDAFQSMRSTIKAVGLAIASVFTPSLAVLGESLRKNFVEIANKYVIPSFQAIARWIQNLSPETKKFIAITTQIIAVGLALSALKSILAVLIPLALPLLAILGVFVGKFILIGIAIGLLVEGFRRLYQWIKNFGIEWSTVFAPAMELFSVIGKEIGAIFKELWTVVSGFFKLVGVVLYSLFVKPLKEVWELTVRFFTATKPLWIFFGKILYGLGLILGGTILGVLKLLTFILKGLAFILSPIFQGLSFIIDLLSSAAWGIILSPFKILVSLLEMIMGALASLGKLHGEMWKKAYENLMPVVDALQSILNFFKAIPEYTKKAIEGIGQFIESPEKTLSKTSDWFLDSLNEIFGGVTKSSLLMPTKPKGAASGAVVVGRTPIIVGEENKPEVVLPLNRLNDVLEKTLSMADRKEMAQVATKQVASAKLQEESQNPSGVDISQVVSLLDKILEELRFNNRNSLFSGKGHVDPMLGNWRV